MKEKIAILGGGAGALTAAFQLTKVPDWQDRYEITVYQQGWRLGGKGASCRRPEEHWRIEEHGPHVWFGFYFNAFQMVDEAYRYCSTQGLLSADSFRTWEEAFQGKNETAVLEYVRDRWLMWLIPMPVRPGTPVSPRVTDLLGHILNAVNFLVEHLGTAQSALPKETRDLLAAGDWLGRVLTGLHRAAARLFGARSPFAERVQGSPLERAATALIPPAGAKTSTILRMLHRGALWIVHYLLSRFAKALHRELRGLLDENADLRHAWQLLDIGIASLRGILADGVLRKGLDAIEDIDFSRWLEKHGCTDSWSPLIRGIYDSGAHYERGETEDSSRPNKRPSSANLAAGTAVHCLLRMFAGYAGSFSYRLNAGMGETVFTPLYLALKHRGVKFAFFHRTMELRANGKNVEEIDISVQAVPKAGRYSYDPLLPAYRGLLCWAGDPFYDQLIDGAKLQSSGANLESAWSGYHVEMQTLRRGVDFDRVVLGITIACLDPICRNLAESDGRWRDMLRRIKTVQTQFYTLWVKKEAQELSGAAGTLTEEGFIEPVDTWLDMSQVIRREGWPGNVKGVHYFVGPLSEDEPPPPIGKPTDFPARQRQRVFQAGLEFVSRNLIKLWPGAKSRDNPGEFDWSLLAAPAGVPGSARFKHQYHRANVDPSDRYVLSTAGSKQYRMRSDDSGFANLFLAGDWTLNGINAGSVEAAVMSGMQASQGISGYPKTILGDWAEMEPRAKGATGA